MADIIRKEDLVPKIMGVVPNDEGGLEGLVKFLEQADSTLDKVNKIMNSPIGIALGQRFGLNIGPKLAPARPQESARIAAAMEKRLDASK